MHHSLACKDYDDRDDDYEIMTIPVPLVVVSCLISPQYTQAGELIAKNEL